MSCGCVTLELRNVMWVCDAGGKNVMWVCDIGGKNVMWVCDVGLDSSVCAAGAEPVLPRGDVREEEVGGVWHRVWGRGHRLEGEGGRVYHNFQTVRWYLPPLKLDPCAL